MVPAFRLAVISRWVVCLLLLLLAGRAKATAQAPTPSLEQTCGRYVKDPEITRAILTILRHAPPDLQPGFEKELAQRIIDEAIARHEGRKLRDDLTAAFYMGTVYQQALTTREGPEGIKIVMRAREFLFRNGDGIGNAIDARTLDAPGAPPPLLPEAEADELLQEAVGGMTDSTKRREARQALDRMHPDVRRALVQIVKQYLLPTGGGPSLMLQGIVSVLSMQLNHPDQLAMYSNPNPFGEMMVPMIQNAAGAPRAFGLLCDALNVMTRFSRHYGQVDWRPILKQYASQGRSDYLTANLDKMLGESVEARPKSTPPDAVR
jgi:hypothetical protein